MTTPENILALICALLAGIQIGFWFEQWNMTRLLREKAATGFRFPIGGSLYQVEDVSPWNRDTEPSTEEPKT